MKETHKTSKTALLIISSLIFLGWPPDAYAHGALDLVTHALLLVTAGIFFFFLMLVLNIQFWRTIHNQEDYQILSPPTLFLAVPIALGYFIFQRYLWDYFVFCLIPLHLPIVVHLYLNSWIVKGAKNRRFFYGITIAYLSALTVTMGIILVKNLKYSGTEMNKRVLLILAVTTAVLAALPFMLKPIRLLFTALRQMSAFIFCFLNKVKLTLFLIVLNIINGLIVYYLVNAPGVIADLLGLKGAGAGRTILIWLGIIFVCLPSLLVLIRLIVDLVKKRDKGVRTYINILLCLIPLIIFLSTLWPAPEERRPLPPLKKPWPPVEEKAPPTKPPLRILPSPDPAPKKPWLD